MVKEVFALYSLLTGEFKAVMELEDAVVLQLKAVTSEREAELRKDTERVTQKIFMHTNAAFITSFARYLSSYAVRELDIENLSFEDVFQKLADSPAAFQGIKVHPDGALQESSDAVG